jgi:putative methyltransferase (TIGR04325 family)
MSDLAPRLRQQIWNIPGLKQVRESGTFNAVFHKGFGAYWGHFKSREEAQSFLRPHNRSTYDSNEIVQFNIDLYFGVQFFDWPVLFFLQTLLRENRLRVVTDFGGHVGVKFYAYRDLLNLPPGFEWQVFDLPAMVAEGRRRLPADVTSLRFFDDLESTSPCDALIFSGVLQYAESTIPEIIGSLPGKPHTVILNKVAVYDESFYSLENYGRYWLPYHIFTLKELEQARTQLGYALSSSWTVPREITVNSAKGRHQIKTIGQVWKL